MVFRPKPALPETQLEDNDFLTQALPSPERQIALLTKITELPQAPSMSKLCSGMLATTVFEGDHISIAFSKPQEKIVKKAKQTKTKRKTKILKEHDTFDQITGWETPEEPYLNSDLYFNFTEDF